MGTYEGELKQSNVIRITGEDEAKAASVTLNCAKNRLHIEGVERLSSALSQAAVSVGTNATDLKVGASNLTNRRNLTIRNNGNRSIYLGTGTVTTANGFPLKSGESITIPVSDDLTIKAITDTGTVDTRILEGS